MTTTRVLVIVTSHGVIDAVPRTGIWFTEFSEPYARNYGALWGCHRKCRGGAAVRRKSLEIDTDQRASGEAHGQIERT